LRILNPHESMLPFAILGGLAWLAIIAGVIVLVIWAVRAFPGNRLMRATPAAVESPLDTLARRFALGEISAEEFERSRDLLRGESSKP
jgi:uncharacterized membrane protein